MAIIIKCDKCECYLDEKRIGSLQSFSTASNALYGAVADERFDYCQKCREEILEILRAIRDK